MSDEKQVIEINGVKMEVDMRHAKRIDTFKIGTKVKLLVKQSHGEPEVKSGVIVGFEPFDTLPTIIVCYLTIDYSGATLKFAYVNEKSNGKYEIVASIDDHLAFDKDDVLRRMDKEEEDLNEKIRDLQTKRNFFLKHFEEWFETA